MNQFPFSEDIQILVWLPLALICLKEVKENWRQIFDKDLTLSDRRALIKITLFFTYPVVVLIHEIGHALATIMLGGVVKELHFGIWWGYVLPVGDFSSLDHLLITLAGNVVQIAIGFLCLIAAVLVSSPPIVALLVYTGLYAIGGTAIIYALMSATDMYLDWSKIYASPHTEITSVVAVCHALIVAFLFYCFYGARPRIWFAGKTRPKWKKDNLAALDRIKTDPSAINYLSLAWSYFFIGMDRLTLKYLDQVKKLDPTLVDRYYLLGCLERNRGKSKAAVSAFEEIVKSRNASKDTKARALMAAGHCLSDDLPPENKSLEDHRKIIETYDQAASLVTDTADPLFYKASLFNKLGLHKEAEFLLKDLDRMKWLDPSLRAGVLTELKVARSKESADE